MSAEIVNRPQEVTLAASSAVSLLESKLNGFFRMSDEAVEKLVAHCAAPRIYTRGETIVRADAAYSNLFIVADGWAVRSRTLSDGGRQIVNVAMPGDVLCLNSLMFELSDFDITAQTDITAFPISPQDLRSVFNEDADLACALFWVSAREECILAERIVSLGRRTAKVRMAHVLSELVARIALVEDLSNNDIMMPMTQEDLADILGLSVVHTNKTLRALHREGILSFRNGILRLHDRAALERLAGFDDGYLHFTVKQSGMAAG